MTYRERDLGVVVIAALGAGYLVGTTMQQQQPAPVAATNGTTIVRRLELPPQPRPERRDGDVLRVVLTTAPLMIQTPPWQDAQPAQQEPEVTSAERAMLLQQQPDKPRDGCYPGHRENFYYRGALHWRCRYGR
jgi:hypothetical protein